MDEFHVQAPTAAGDRSPGQGGMYFRNGRKAPKEEAKPASAPAPAATLPDPDPAAALLEALDRLRSTEERPKDGESQRLVRGQRIYRQAGDGSSAARRAVSADAPPPDLTPPAAPVLPPAPGEPPAAG